MEKSIRTSVHHDVGRFQYLLLLPISESTQTLTAQRQKTAKDALAYQTHTSSIDTEQ